MQKFLTMIKVGNAFSNGEISVVPHLGFVYGDQGVTGYQRVVVPLIFLLLLLATPPEGNESRNMKRWEVSFYF